MRMSLEDGALSNRRGSPPADESAFSAATISKDYFPGSGGDNADPGSGAMFAGLDTPRVSGQACGGRPRVADGILSSTD